MNTDKSFADLWAESEEYTPQTEGSLEEQIARRRNPNWIYLTEDDVLSAKSFDNRLYSDYYDMDCEDLIETAKEEMEEDGELEIIFACDYNLENTSIKLFETSCESETYLLIDGDLKFIFHGYDTRVINTYNELIIIGGKEQVIIYDSSKKLLTKLN